MAKLCLTVTRDQMPALLAVLNVLFDLPKKVNHIGAGARVGVDPSLSGAESSGCWITRAQPFYKNPSNVGGDTLTDEFAIEVTDELKSLWQAKQALFKPGVVTTVQNQVSTAAALSAAWNTTDPATGTVYIGTESGEAGFIPADPSTVLA